MTPSEARALDIARALAEAGQRVFVARPAKRQTTKEDGSPGPLEWDPRGGTGSTGFKFPSGWQTVAPDPSVVDEWKPGYAIAVVTGGPLDVIDIDPRNGGDEGALAEALDGEMPNVWGRATTPSGGEHLFIAALGIGKGKPVVGVDLQAGAPDGKGRGFVFLAPTVRVSKVTGEPTPYVWTEEPDVDPMLLDLDTSGAALRELMRPAEREPVRKMEGEATPWEIEEARVILDQQIDKLRNAPDGDRNNTCVSVLSTLMMLVVGGCLDETEVVERAGEAAEEVGLEAEEFENALSSATEYAEADGGTRPEVSSPGDVFGPVVGTSTMGAGEPGVAPEFDPTKCEWNECAGDKAEGSKWCDDHTAARRSDEEKSATLSVIEYEKHNLAADIHVARRIAVEYLEPRVRAFGRAGWAVWNGKVWDVEGLDDRVHGMIQRACLDIHRKEEARARKYMEKQTADGDGEARKKYNARMKIVDRILMAGFLGSIQRMVRPYLSVSQTMFDGPGTRDLLNCPNGVVDLRTGEVGPHRRDLYFTKITGVGYEPGAEHADWKMSLDALEPEEIDYLQLRLGQATTGYSPGDDVVTFLGGGGENGKSTIVDSVHKALGGYFSYVPKDVILDGQKHDSLMFALKGVRLAVIEELPRGRWLDVEALKDIAGTYGLKARAMRETYYTHWTATHSVVITSNYLVRVVETDHSVWRRLERILFARKFDGSDPDHPGDSGLRGRMREGRGGRAEAVLAWLVEGAKKVGRMKEEESIRDRQPERVRAETEKWRSAGNPIVQFANDFLEYDPECASLSSDVYRGYAEWSKATGTKPVSDQVFWSRMGDTNLMGQPGVDKVLARVTGWKIRSSRAFEEGSRQRILTAVKINFDTLGLKDFAGNSGNAEEAFS